MTRTEKEIKPPSRAAQASVVFAYRKIVYERRTPEGLPWKPDRVLDELWNSWKERPTGPGERQRFWDKHKQALSNLKRGVTNSLRDHGQLFVLLERFVVKFSEPGDYFVPAHIISDIHAAGRALGQMAHAAGESTFRGANRYGPPDEIVPPGQVLNSRAEVVDPRTRRIRKTGVARIRKHNMSDLIFSLAYQVPDAEDPQFCQYWPMVLVGEDEFYAELGFYVPRLELAILRAISWSPLPDRVKVGRDYDLHVKRLNYRILHFYDHGSGGRMAHVSQKFIHFPVQDEISRVYETIASVDDELLSRVLPILDLLDQ